MFRRHEIRQKLVCSVKHDLLHDLLKAANQLILYYFYVIFFYLAFSFNLKLLQLSLHVDLKELLFISMLMFTISYKKFFILADFVASSGKQPEQVCSFSSNMPKFVHKSIYVHAIYFCVCVYIHVYACTHTYIIYVCFGEKYVV